MATNGNDPGGAAEIKTSNFRVLTYDMLPELAETLSTHGMMSSHSLTNLQIEHVTGRVAQWQGA